MTLTHGSLFSGIGGFDLAAEWAGWENIFHCEWNPFGQKVLTHYWPEAKSYHDITQTDFSVHRNRIDVLTGGFPCQPYSMAGKRKGKEDERHLWPEMLRAIREIQPRWVVGENVLGLVNWNGGLVFHEVQADLEAEGYEVQPYVLPACSVNAPHKRQRIWFIAHSSSLRCGGGRLHRDSITQERAVYQNKQSNGNSIWSKIAAYSPSITITSSKGLQGDEQSGSHKGEDSRRETGTHGTATKFYRGNHWEEWPTQSPLCHGNDGLSGRLDGITFSKWRNESIKAGGNAIVPQVAYELFKVINQMERVRDGGTVGAPTE
jgi:DNA (cytosine-5)-methyltransferase 1